MAGIVPGLVRQPSAAGRGGAGHCNMAVIPTIEEEDARRPNRERENLVGERTRIVNRIKTTLARSRGFEPSSPPCAMRTNG